MPKQIPSFTFTDDDMRKIIINISKEGQKNQDKKIQKRTQKVIRNTMLCLKNPYRFIWNSLRLEELNNNQKNEIQRLENVIIEFEKNEINAKESDTISGNPHDRVDIDYVSDIRIVRAWYRHRTAQLNEADIKIQEYHNDMENIEKLKNVLNVDSTSGKDELIQEKEKLIQEKEMLIVEKDELIVEKGIYLQVIFELTNWVKNVSDTKKDEPLRVFINFECNRVPLLRWTKDNSYLDIFIHDISTFKNGLPDLQIIEDSGKDAEERHSKCSGMGMKCPEGTKK